jgi:hypothetical protein
MAWGADVVARVMQHEVLEMDEFAVDPQRGAGIGKVGSFDPALPDRRTGNPLLQCGFLFVISNRQMSYAG